MAKRKISLLLILAMLISTVAACGDETPSGDDTTISGDSAENQSSYNFNGREFRVAVSPYSESDILAPEESTGEVTDDAMYKRNLAVEDRLGVKIKSVMLTDDNGKWYDTLTTSIYAADDDYELAGHVSYRVYTAISNSIFHDLTKVKGFEFDKPWWIAEINDRATINGKLFAATGYMGMSVMELTQCMFYNVRLADEYGIKSEDLYKLVNDGDWTFDKFGELVADMYEDLNGNGERDESDFYGFALNSSNGKDLWQSAFDMPVTSVENGKFKVELLSEKRVSALEMINTFFATNKGAKLLKTKPDQTSWGWYEQYNFSVGRQTFTTGPFKAAFNLFRDMKDEYGILPLPKYDESQEKYYSELNDDYSIWGIPVTVTDTDFVGIVANEIAKETYTNVYPAYYDVALKGKYSLDEETAKIVDTVAAGMRFDIACMFGLYLESLPYMFRTCITNESNDLASLYDSKKEIIEKGLETIYGYYK